MKYSIRLFFLLIIHLLSDLSLCDRCCTINLRKLPLYKLNRYGGHSNETIFSRKVVYNLNQCKRFASSKRALAFNFGEYGKEIGYDHCMCLIYNLIFFLNKENIVTYRPRKDISKRYICEIFECPKINNPLLRIKDKNYRYYSMYPNYIPSGNHRMKKSNSTYS